MFCPTFTDLIPLDFKYVYSTLTLKSIRFFSRTASYRNKSCLTRTSVLLNPIWDRFQSPCRYTRHVPFPSFFCIFRKNFPPSCPCIRAPHLACFWAIPFTYCPAHEIPNKFILHFCKLSRFMCTLLDGKFVVSARGNGMKDAQSCFFLWTALERLCSFCNPQFVSVSYMVSSLVQACRGLRWR